MATLASGVKTRPVVTAWFEVFDVEGKWIKRGEVGFQEVDGLDRETAVIEHKQGNDLFSDQIPGRTMPAKLTLKKGLDLNNALERWKAAVEESTALADAELRADVVVAMYDRQGTPGSATAPGGAKLIKQWRIQAAWISKLSTSGLGGLANELGTVTAELCGYGPPIQTFPPLNTQNIA